MKDKDDKEVINSKLDELSTSLQKIGEAMQKASETSSSTTDDQGKENVRDAEVSEEKPEDKK